MDNGFPVYADGWWNDPQGMRSGLRYRQVALPAGKIHVAPTNSDATLCERPVRSLWPWPNARYETIQSAEKCPKCRELLGSVASAARP